jgi:hypothetical protein
MVDWLIVSNSLGKTGYLQADLNLDGVVTTNDLGVGKIRTCEIGLSHMSLWRKTT